MITNNPTAVNAAFPTRNAPSFRERRNASLRRHAEIPSSTKHPISTSDKHRPHNQQRPAASKCSAPLIHANAAHNPASIYRRDSSRSFFSHSAKRTLRSSSLKAALMITTAIAFFGSTLYQSNNNSSNLSTSAVMPDTSSISDGSSDAVVNLVAIAPLNSQSDFGVSWGEVLEHTAERLTWSNKAYKLTIIDAESFSKNSQDNQALLSSLQGGKITQTPLVMAIDVKNQETAELISKATKDITTFVSLRSASVLEASNRIDGRTQVKKPPGFIFQFFQGLFLSEQTKRDQEAFETIQELFLRFTSDDLAFTFLILVNEVVAPVAEIANGTKSKKAGKETVDCMLKYCRDEIINCYLNTQCRTALNCLNKCSFNDQVCSYLCLASYETPQLEAFSLCILQKHNCLELDAEMPTIPDPAPLASFRGQPMTHELAEDIFLGWHHLGSSKLRKKEQGTQDYSWRVFSGKNPAYDYFPCQFQLFYRDKRGLLGWYDPVFKVNTLDGRQVWRQRHYRVKRGEVPGTFYFTVLDNGVTSNEYWKIIDCDDDGFHWCIFYYGGAAKAAGINYRGAILVSEDGKWPVGAGVEERIAGALDRAGIKMWELSSVKNDMCQDVPLEAMQPQLT